MTIKELVQKYGLAVTATIPPEAILGNGNVYFVDSNATLALDANNGVAGNSWDSPFATLNYAISRCTSSQADVILLAEGHAETIEDKGTASGTTTDEVTVDKIGVSIIGMGQGTVMPTFTLEGATDATINVTVGNVRIKGIRIISNLADVAVGLTLGAAADGAIIEDCVFRDGAAAKELVIGITVTAACNDIKILNNTFSTVPAGGCASAINMPGACNNSIIRGNVAYGTYSGGALDANTAAQVNITIQNNVFCNAAAVGVALHASTTGVLSENYIGGTTSVAAALTGDTAIFCFENYVNGNVAESGTLSPAVE